MAQKFLNGIASTGNVLPSVDSTYDLGHNSYRWANLYVDAIGTTSTFVSGGTIALQSNISTLNKAETAYVSFATRNISGSETLMDLSNVGTINAGTINVGNVSMTGLSATAGSFTQGVTIADVIDGDFTALRLMNQKTYGSGTGTNEKVRFVMGISESNISFAGREGFAIEVGVGDQSDSSDGVVEFKVRDGGTLGTYSTVTGSNKSVSFVGDLTANNLSGTNTGDQDLSGYATTGSIPTDFVSAANGGTFNGDVVINSAGDAASPLLRLNNSSSSAFNHALEALNANLTTTETELLLVGKSADTRNSGYIGFNWVADNSNSNYISIGHWGYNHLLKIYPTGDAAFSGNTLVNGGLKIDGGTDLGSQLCLFADSNGHTSLAGYDFEILNGSNNGRARTFFINSTGAIFAGNVNISSPGDLYINSGTSYNDVGSVFMSNQRTEISSIIVDGTSNGDTALNFKTRSAGATASAMFINEFRKVGIGQTQPSQLLHVGDGSDSTRGIISIEGAGGQHLIFSENSGFSSANAFCLRPASGTDFIIQQDGNSTKALTIDTSANATFAGTVTCGNLHASSFTDVITNSILTASADLDIKTVLTTRDVRFRSGSNAVQLRVKGDATGILINDHAGLRAVSATSATATTIVAEVPHALYNGIFFDFVIKNGTNVRAGTLTVCHDGTNVEYAETSTVDLGDTSDVTLSSNISGTSIRLIATTTSSTWTIKSLIRTI